MKILKISVLALSLGGIGFINTTFADNYSSLPKYPMMKYMQTCSQYKSLPAEQKAKVDKILQDLDSKSDPIRQQVMAKHEELSKLFSQQTLDEKAINGLVKEISELHDQMFVAHINARIEMIKAGFSAEKCWKAAHPMMQRPMLQYPMMKNIKMGAQYKSLSTEQKDKVDKIVQDLKSKCEPLRQQVMAKHEELKKLFAQPTLDEKAINSLVTEISGLHDQMLTLHFDARMEMTKVGFSVGKCWKDVSPMMSDKMEMQKK